MCLLSLPLWFKSIQLVVNWHLFSDMNHCHITKMPRLDLYINYELQATVKLDRSEIRIGRDPKCEMQLPDERVSRLHAIIRQIGEGHEIEDNSTNGIKLNGAKVVSTQALKPGDAIFIQNHILMYQADEVPPDDLKATILAD